MGGKHGDLVGQGAALGLNLAVVDQHGQVYGAEGLRVVDASIMPECVRANINVTVLMIGERVADLIKQGK